MTGLLGGLGPLAMTGLPGDLAAPLHLIEPFPWRRALLVATVAALIVATLVLMWRRMLRARRARPRPAPPPPAPAPAPPSGLAAAIAALREQILRVGLFRQGCHELTRLLKAHFEGVEQRPYSTLTAREIGRLVGERPVARLLALLADLQFGRRPPDRDDFEGACLLALEMSLPPRARGRR